MLSQENRLKKPKDIDLTFSQGRTTKSGFLFLKFLYNKERMHQPTRIAFMVGLNFSKKAIQRNKMKRWMRVAVREHLDQLPIGYDLVFFLKSQHDDSIDYSIVKNNTLNCLKNIKK